MSRTAWRCGTCGRTSEADEGQEPGTATIHPDYRTGRDIAGCQQQTTWRRTRTIAEAPTAVARRTDPATSHEAARSHRDAGTIRARIIDLLWTEGPMTDEQLVALFERLHPATATPSGIRTRRAELVADGYVEQTSRPGRTKAGRRATIWAARGDARGRVQPSDLRGLTAR
jgi:hypothetical protein